MDDRTLLALCIWEEARGEVGDGKAAVARVVLNRMKLHYFSDGTMAGTVLAKDQFSGFWFDFVGRSYIRVCHTLEQAEAKADRLLKVAGKAQVWGYCLLIAAEVRDGSYNPTDGYEQMTDQAVLYLNPAIIKPGHMPAWANPDKHICRIGHHDFYAA